MEERISLSSGSPKYAREILLHLKKLETILDEKLSGISFTAEELDTTLSTLNDYLVAILVTSKRPPVSTTTVEEDSISIPDADVLADINNIYNSITIEEFKNQLTELKSEQPDLDYIIPLITGSNNLDNWVTVIQFVTNRLDNIILSKLRELYAVIESMKIETGDQLLDEVTNIISVIIDVCKINRKIILHLDDLNNKLMVPEIVEGIEDAQKSLNKTTVNQ